MSSTKRANIMIIDDVGTNLQLLEAMLSKRDYRVRPFSAGAMALRSAAVDPPDLILLDINMPDMNGYEVCRRLKADPALCGIPILFLSALDEPLDKVKAFSCGGVDYVTKPFQIEEIEARIQTHLTIRRLQLEQQEQNRQLRRSLERQRELEALRDSLMHMIVHDLRSPLTGMIGFLDLLTIDAGERMTNEDHNYIDKALTCASDLMAMINTLLDVHKLESGQMPLSLGQHDLGTLITSSLDSLGALSTKRDIRVQQPSEPLLVRCDREIIRRVLVNLVGNAIKFTEPGAAIRIMVHRDLDSTRVAVIDHGPGIASEHHQRIFQKFGHVATQKDKRVYSSGLGLTFCKLAIEAHQGRIGVISSEGQGSEFWFTLPD